MNKLKFEDLRNSTKCKSSNSNRPASANNSALIDPMDNEEYSLRGMQHEGKNKKNKSIIVR